MSQAVRTYHLFQVHHLSFMQCDHFDFLAKLQEQTIMEETNIMMLGKSQIQ